MERADLIFALAIAAQGRSTQALVPRLGEVVTAAPDGLLVVDTRHGRALLVLASDARIEMRAGPVTRDAIRPGDMVTWHADTADPVTYVTDLTVATARECAQP